MASPIPNPIDNPVLYDVVTIAGLTSQGVISWPDGERAFDWDTKKGKGASGATTTFQGRDIATPTIEFRFWTPEQVDWYHEQLLPLLTKALEAPSPTALEIYHPTLAALGIEAVQVKKIGTLSRKKGGLYTVKIEFTEYRPPKPIKGTGTAGKSAANVKLAEAAVDFYGDAASKMAGAVGDAVNTIAGWF